MRVRVWRTLALEQATKVWLNTKATTGWIERAEAGKAKPPEITKEQPEEPVMTKGTATQQLRRVLRMNMAGPNRSSLEEVRPP